MSTPENSNGNLVGDHMYTVTGLNAATDTFTIQNPWNTAYSGPLAMSFTETIQQLAQDNCSLYATNGRPQFGCPRRPRSDGPLPALRPKNMTAGIGLTPRGRR
jgi:hypothetical protein